MKEELIDLYKDAMLLGKYIELEHIAKGMMPSIHPGKELEDLSEEELITLTKAVITGMTSWLC